ncbi:MAG: trypsin-like peptidase domain-containing protein [Kofleriaceae bacterium]|nr:trypsin-like peptidase domain-containing protein [Kofleriaceae bacterium]
MPLAQKKLGATANSQAETIRRSVVMVVVVNESDGVLTPISSGSGTIIDVRGFILTNAHVLYDANNRRLHDRFIIGLFRASHALPEFVCSGSPASGISSPTLDLALIQCDRDLQGAPWPGSAWPALAIPSTGSAAITKGSRISVIGYPGTASGQQRVSAGTIREDQSGGEYLKTNAYIGHGYSGGIAIDAEGEIIGVPSGFRRAATTQNHIVVPTTRIGLIRPLSHLRQFLSQALPSFEDKEEK